MSLAAFRRLELQVRRRVAGLGHGDNESLRLGQGSVAEEIVRYQPGDDVRWIDWNVSARSMDPHVWRPRADHELETWVLVDETPSMAFGSGLARRATSLRWSAVRSDCSPTGPGTGWESPD